MVSEKGKETVKVLILSLMPSNHSCFRRSRFWVHLYLTLKFFFKFPVTMSRLKTGDLVRPSGDSGLNLLLRGIKESPASW